MNLSASTASILMPPRYLAHFPFRIAAAHRKLRKLRKTRFIASHIDELASRVLIAKTIFSSAWWRFLLTFIKSEIIVGYFSLPFVLSFWRVDVYFRWLFMWLFLLLITLFLPLIGFIHNLFVLFTWVFFVLVKLICTVFVLLEPFFEIFLFGFGLVPEPIPFNQWFDLAFGFLLEMINFYGLILYVISIWCLRYIFGLFELFKLF